MKVTTISDKSAFLTKKRIGTQLDYILLKTILVKLSLKGTLMLDKIKTKISADLFEVFKKEGIELTSSQQTKLIEQIEKISTYQPKVGLFGKTGVGKSSLVNALFGEQLCEVSDIAACTREPKEVLLQIGKSKGITLLDVPGLGENSTRDSEYSELYSKLLPELDLVLWVLKADDRAFTVDQKFYLDNVKPHLKEGKPFFFVINQADKIEPFREWDEVKKLPGSKQSANLREKTAIVAEYFNAQASSIICVSASEKYNLPKLVEEIIFALPPEKLVTFAAKVKKENISTVAARHIEKATAQYVTTGAGIGAAIGGLIGGPIGAAVLGAVGAFGGWVASKCFISSATMLTLGKSDTCEELQLLRTYRDNILRKERGGERLIREYYSVAPQMVDAIEKRKDSNKLYEDIWNNHLRNIVQEIRRGHYAKAKKSYISMVKSLREKL